MAAPRRAAGFQVAHDGRGGWWRSPGTANRSRATIASRGAGALAHGLVEFRGLPLPAGALDARERVAQDAARELRVLQGVERAGDDGGPGGAVDADALVLVPGQFPQAGEDGGD